MADVAPYDRQSELKAFDDTKAGVKGLVDSGIDHVPRFFIRPPEELKEIKSSTARDTISANAIPVIDLRQAADATGRKEIASRILSASERWGFFQVINHGVPLGVLAEVKEGVRRFHELPNEEKMGFYIRDTSRSVQYSSNFDLYQAPAANWRDTLFCVMGPNPLDPHQLPSACRHIVMEYSKHVTELGKILFELIAEGLGLSPSYLIDMDCLKGHALLFHYYPACPEPELTLGTSKHSDPDFLTILLQDHIGGLQVLHQNQWIDVPPVEGAFVVNIGDLLQLMTNGKLKSVEHRVKANLTGPRVSVACFFTTHKWPSTRLYGPIKELLTDDNPPIYRETSVKDFVTYYNAKGLDGKSALDSYRL